MTIDNSSGANERPKTIKYSHIVAVQGDLRVRLLQTQAFHDRVMSQDGNTLVFGGFGDYFPKMEGAEWMAEAYDPAPRKTDSSAFDLCWLVDLLLEESPIVCSESPTNEVLDWLRRKGLV